MRCTTTDHLECFQTLLRSHNTKLKVKLSSISQKCQAVAAASKLFCFTMSEKIEIKHRQNDLML